MITECTIENHKMNNNALLETNNAPEILRLEDEFPLGWLPVGAKLVLGSVCVYIYIYESAME